MAGVGAITVTFDRFRPDVLTLLSLSIFSHSLLKAGRTVLSGEAGKRSAQLSPPSSICLTRSSRASSLCRMWCAQALVLALTVSFCAYGLDCLAMTTPDAAMDCCKAMRCHYHRHRGQNSQDCCKTAPQMHGVATQPVAILRVISSPVVVGVVRDVSPSEQAECHSLIAPHSHDPPSDAVSAQPLRV